MAIATRSTGFFVTAAAWNELVTALNALIVYRQELWIPAKDWFPDTTAPCASLATRQAGTSQDYQHLAFDGTTAEIAHTTLSLPKGWDNGTITYRVYWSAIAGGAGGVVWRVGGRALSDDDTYAAAIGTQIDVTDTFIAIDDLHISAESAAVTIAGTPADEDAIRLQLDRNPADAADTRAADANFIGLKVFFTKTTLSDA